MKLLIVVVRLYILVKFVDLFFFLQITADADEVEFKCWKLT